MNDPEMIANVLRSAHQAVEAAEMPEDLRIPAFETAAALLQPFDGASSQVPVGAPNPSLGVPPAGDSPAVAKAAQKLRVQKSLLSRVLDFDQDGVHVIVQRSKLAKTKAEAIQQVATLVVAGRQATGIDPDGWTQQSHVREATEALGVDDPKNFATHLKRVNGIRSRGSGKTGELKMNAVGFEAAADLIRQLAAESSAG
jgi:hypothetical protein